ncbi:ABC transporter ATP-binding protein [Terasakiella sp. A23]|uniref:ABC transporter ATP-binding protein n=1 Tax=Terasakiella sp. FCG-A23 TaxID=3080561 RepID=UPI0029557248|nr:ABC transporter ATP-binding protein [Terasakiella sp. A23]MDV7338624.1 ABC transporter ATP-binding protein [Terasakiella sp. A23]
MANILSVIGLNKSFGALHATDQLNLSVEEGTIHGLIGPNGAGKTTAINQLSGEMMPDSGTIIFNEENITNWPIHKRAQFGLQRSYQITSLFPEFTALDNVAIAIQATDGHSFRFWKKARTDASLIDPAMEVLKQVGLDHIAHTPVTDLAHGQQRQIELAMTLATKPKMLLLDEPMAGMGKTESQAMMEVLRPLKGKITILMVEHDMDVVFALADKVSVLVRGHCIVTGTPDEIRANEDVRTAYLGDG